MFRVMYDGITPSGLPRGGQLYASYVDGHWPNYGELARLFPLARHVSIAVDPAHDAMVLDCERYDARPDQCPDWARRQRHRGQVPTIYCNTSTWPSVHEAFRSQGVPRPLWWAANYSIGPNALPAGAIALQYKSTATYDQSIVAAYWPGVDPPRTVPQPSPAPALRWVVRRGDTLSGIAEAWRIGLRELEAANPHAGHPAGNFDVLFPGDVIRHP